VSADDTREYSSCLKPAMHVRQLHLNLSPFSGKYNDRTESLKANKIHRLWL
jgi:hypothetical protein